MGARSTSFLITSSWLSILVASPSLSADLAVNYPYPDPKAPAGSLPAVSGVNGKAIIYGGVADGDSVVTGAGTVSLPIGHAYGLQIDASVGTRDGDTTFHGGGHLFWRDPAVGLFGVYAAYHSIGGDHFSRYALEAHHYSGSWTVEGFAGWDDGEDRDAFFGLAELSKYIHDDFRITGGVGYSDWESGDFGGAGLVGTAGVEWQTNWLGPKHGQTLFASGQFGDGYTAVVGGMKLYIGSEPKSLIRRHREDDPPPLDVGVSKTPPALCE